MMYHIITTPDCNLCCAYCAGKAFDEPEDAGNCLEFEPLPVKISYSMQDLNSFLAKDMEKKGLIFYGGEPLVALQSVKQVMDSVQADYFMLQTNGILLNLLPKEYANRFHTIFVSIDGGKERTNANRGEGTFERVTANLKLLRLNGFKGEIIARMTVEEPAGFFDDIQFLLENKDFPFSSVHWQLDANMWHDYEKRNFSKWSKAYNNDVSKLVDYWLSELEKGNVLRLYPFMGLLDAILNKTQYHLPCGSGVGNFSILTNGEISACPIMAGVKDKYVGNIRESTPSDLPFKITVGGPCVSCEVFGYCGGRCLYSNIAKPWPEKGFREVCGTVKHLVKDMQRIRPKVKALLDNGTVKWEQLAFVKYNSAEIIP